MTTALYLSTDQPPTFLLVQLHHIACGSAMIRHDGCSPTVVPAKRLLHSWPGQPDPKLWAKVRQLQHSIKPDQSYDATADQARQLLRGIGIR